MARIARVLRSHGVLADGGLEEPARLRAALEELGPTFCKLGQVLSTRPDLVGPRAADELARLQDDVPPEAPGAVEGVLAEELGADWATRLHAFDPLPLGAGTIAQVHRARLPDGEPVVVKVQRPGADAQIRADLALMRTFARRAGRRPAIRRLLDIEAVFDHLASGLEQELDFAGEARAMQQIGRVAARFPHVGVPLVHGALSTRRVLVMQEVPAAAPIEGQAAREAARDIVACFWSQILDDGLFHADPHPGNLRFDGERLWLLDFGLVGTLSSAERDALLELGLGSFRGDAAAVAEALCSVAGGECDLAALTHDLEPVVAHLTGAGVAVDLGPVMEGLARAAARHGLRPPAALLLAGKALGQAQATAVALDPDLDPIELIESVLRRRMLARLIEHARPQAAAQDLIAATRRAERLLTAVEGVLGARPAAPLRVDVPAADRIEAALRRLGIVFVIAVLGAGLLIAIAILIAGS